MATIVLHRLTDWPTFRHVRPLLDALGIGAEALERWHFFYAEDAIAKSPFGGIREVGGQPEHEEALLAASLAFAVLAPDLVGPPDGELAYGFHWSASKDELVAIAKKKGHAVAFAADAIAARTKTPEHLVPLYAKWELADLRAMTKEALEPASAKLALAYVEGKEAVLPPLARKEGATASLELSFDVAEWTPRHERMLDVFVAASGGRACPTQSPASASGPLHADSAGRLRDLLAARGVADSVLFDALCTREMGARRNAFGHREWPSRHALLATWFARLDDVVAMGTGRAAALFEAQLDFPIGLRILAGILTDRWCRRGGFAKLDLAGLEACTYLDGHEAGEAFDADAGREHTASVLALASPSMSDLIAVSHRGVAKKDQRRFDAAVKSAAARDDVTLAEWKEAKEREIVTGAMFDAGVVPAFRRATAAGFRKAPDGYGDHDGFVAAAPVVGAVDPDACLRGFVALTSRFNEHGLKANAKDWDAALPKRGFGKAALAEASAHFSSPGCKSTAKILAKMLAARGIEVTNAKPPALGAVDETFHVGTDVAHLIIGSYDGVEAVADAEDPDDWPKRMKKHGCVGLQTGGDGQYRVRVVGGARGKGALVATFPLVIRGDALTVSGIVGAGGTPTIAFPSGNYAADVVASKDGAVTIFVTKPKSMPKWTFGDDLPQI
ncbi:MAG TPA: hypothetical protein VGH28_10830 [Polyangiaceae bacterium]|jgi:hypothetical protein